MFEIYTIKHRTYPEGPTRTGTTACAKRVLEKVESELKFTMDRLTNLYKLMVGFKVPHIYYVQSVLSYVILNSPIQIKQPVPIRKSISESPKVNIMQIYAEFRISRNTKVWGRRSFRSTVIINGKGNSLMSSFNLKLPGFIGDEELSKLIVNSKNFNLNRNLTKILSNPNFLIACWVRIKSNSSNLTKSLETEETLGRLKKTWFDNIAKEIGTGSFSFKPTRKTNILNQKDKIVQEAIKLLLEIMFEDSFLDCSYGFKNKKECETVLSYIKIKFTECVWFIKGDITQFYSSIDHHILVELIKTKVDDQSFIDLIYKYLKMDYSETKVVPTRTKIGITQEGILSPILSNIYLNKFDIWMINYLQKKFNNDISIGDNFKKLIYVRYVDDFLIGITGSKEDCIFLREEIRKFLDKTLKLKLNVEKSKITHATSDSVFFLGYSIHLTTIKKMSIRYNLKSGSKKFIFKIQLVAPISWILKKLHENHFSKSDGSPTRNGRFIALPLIDLIEHFKSVEKGIINYYKIANNFKQMAARVHYILKYSCALTIASKMGLKTLRKVYRKYGANLSIKDSRGKIITSYFSSSYKKSFKDISTLDHLKVSRPDLLISKLSEKICKKY